jgi:hypothetical protein
MKPERHPTTNEIRRFGRRSGPASQNSTIAYPVSLFPEDPVPRRKTTLAFVSSVDRRATGLAPQFAAHLLARSLLGPSVGSSSAGR